MKYKRSAGILLHVTSLPGRYGIGDLGEGAYRFIDWLKAAGQSWWQVLPLGLPGAAEFDNPYCPQSSWAGYPLLISLDELVKAGDLTPAEAAGARVREDAVIRYAPLKASRRKLFPMAARRFFERADKGELRRFAVFCRSQKTWLDDWTLYAAARQRFGDKPWWRWPKELSARDAEALRRFRRELKEPIQAERYLQFRFFEQWDRVRAYARAAGIKLIGDVPVYCARDSQDVWSARAMFKIDAHGKPLGVGGVPPDYYSKTGQVWGGGMPVYDWRANRANRYRWWVSRLRGCLRTVDVVRVDHFLGFNSYYEIPGGAKTAVKGRWVKGPGDELFKAIKRELGEVPFIAEDLGIITPEVLGLRDRWDLPGMRVLQFAFSGDPRNNIHLPIWHMAHSVVYPGTHDNDTSAGWYRKASAAERRLFRSYAGSDGRRPHLDMIRLAYGSVANMAIIPMQDVLGLDSSARMNTPSVIKDKFNYVWKLKASQLKPDTAKMLAENAAIYGR
jgi:4-alpha-glucanotransferase